MIVCRRYRTERYHSAESWVKKSVGLNDIALHDKSSQSYEASLAVWDHSVTFHPTQVNSPRLTPVRQAGTWFIYLPRRDGRLSWPGVAGSCNFPTDSRKSSDSKISIKEYQGLSLLLLIIARVEKIIW